MGWPHSPDPASPCTGSGRTLRETVLESSPVLALLNESFISTWSLVKELEDLRVSGGWIRTASWEPLGPCWGPRSQGCAPLSPQNNRENPSHKKLAELHLEKYSFPVEMMICLPNGTVVSHPTSTSPGLALWREEAASQGHRLTTSSGFRSDSTTS